MNRSLIAILVLIFLATQYSSKFRITKNFYEEDPGRLFRSAQLTESELEEAIAKYKIKTVISLRGEPPSVFGGEPEAVTLARKKILYYHFGLDTDYYPSKEDLNKILDLFHDAPKPILIHCRTGADRTGMLAAIYAIEEMKQSKEVALRQLSIKYWHVRMFHPAMADFVEIYKGRDWAKLNYDPCQYPDFNEHQSACVERTQYTLDASTRKFTPSQPDRIGITSALFKN